MERGSKQRAPRAIADSLAGLLQRTGLAERLGAQPAIDALRRALGPAHAEAARAVRLRQGELEVEVASAALLHELTHFRKRTLLERIRREAPSLDVRSLRFRLAATPVRV